MIEYKIVKITDLGTVNRGKSKHRPRNDSLLYGGKYPFIQTADIKKANLYLNDYSQTYNEIGLKQSKLWKKGTLCFTIAANIADSAILDIDACFPDSIVGFLPYENVSDTIYVKYLFDELKLYFQQISKGTTQDNLSLDKICRVKLRVPNYETQKKIALVLSTYDKLIENNNKRIKLLEQITENLYKEWFVRFRFPGYENTKFVDGIPSDWQILRMSDFCYVTDGTHDTPKPINDGGVPLVTGKCIKNGFIDFNEPYNISYQDHESISKRSGLQTGDILFSNIGTVGTTCLVNYDREFSVKNVIIFKPGNIKVSNYLYSWLNSDPIQAIFATQTNGASQQFVGLNFMRRFKILVPNENVLDLYSDRIKPIRTEIVKLHDINENLIKQRDMLLPRLMSGKLEV